MKAVMRDEREMKDSGIDWIGKIPNCWRTSRLKDISEIQTGSTPDKKFQAEYYSRENGVPWIKAENLGMPNPICTTKEYLTKNGCDVGRVFPANTVYVCCIASIGKVGYSTIPCSCNQQINGILFDNKYIDYKFGYYLSIAQEEEYILRASGNVLKILNTQQQSYIPCVIPLLNEQQLIAHYLDDRCFKIDAIIAEAKASIEEYKELKQAVIYEAVTKGLDKNVEMKDSGVEWVGTLPSHWNYRKLRYSINDIGDIDHYMPESVTNGIPYIMTGDLKNRVSEIDFDKCKHVSRNDYEKLSTKIKAEKGDIIFARYATIGALCYVDIDADFLVSYSCVIIKPNSKSIDSHFLEYYLQSSSFIEEAKRYANSNVQANIGKESMFQVKIALPSLDEQKKIVDFLDFKITCLDNLINEKQNLIEDLEAYKKSLIYEVVTGKRKVVA